MTDNDIFETYSLSASSQSEVREKKYKRERPKRDNNSQQNINDAFYLGFSVAILLGI